MPYLFSLVRFVPDPARGEFVNIGAIAADGDEEDWAVRWISNYTRAKALDVRGYLPVAKAFTATLDERVGEADRLTLDVGGDRPSLEWLTELATDMNNIVQISEPAPVVADSAEEALDLVFERLIVDPAKARFRFKKKHQAQAATRGSYRAADVPLEAVAARSRVARGPYDFTFDFAVRNGQAVQLAQCFSFELPNQAELTEQVKAWAWMVHEVKEHGAVLRAETDTEVPSEVDIAAVFIPPTPDGDRSAYEEAEDAFEQLGVNAARWDHADQIGQAAARLLAVPH